jgi:sugar phosphate isomerase/epimerase
MEMDIYWVVRAGHDPVKIFEKHPGRFAMVHVKDMDKTNNELNTEIGSGTIDFKTILGKAQLAGIKHFIVEQENYTSILIHIKALHKAVRILKNSLHL